MAYCNAPVPPDAVAVTTPVVPPKHATSVVTADDAVIG